METDLRSTVNRFLALKSEVALLQEKISALRARQKEDEKRLVALMARADLRVLRVLTHESGPHDITLQKKAARLCVITPAKLESFLAGYVGQNLTEDTLRAVLDHFKQPQSSQEILRSIRATKIKRSPTRLD